MAAEEVREATRGIATFTTRFGLVEIAERVPSFFRRGRWRPRYQAPRIWWSIAGLHRREFGPFRSRFEALLDFAHRMRLPAYATEACELGGKRSSRWEQGARRRYPLAALRSRMPSPLQESP